MSRPTSRARNTELAKIHIGKKQLGLDDEKYRDLLHCLARVRSAGDLDDFGRRKVINHMRKCGVTFTKSKASSRYQIGSQEALIRHIWDCLHEVGAVDDKSDRAMNAWCERQTRRYMKDGVGISSVFMMDGRMLNRLIEELKAWCDRIGFEFR